MKKSILFLIVTSCSSLPEVALSGDVAYPQLNNRATLKFEADGQQIDGIGVVDRKASMNFKFMIPPGTIQFTITTCNREEYFSRPESGKVLSWNFSPMMYVENLRSCFLTATAVTKAAETIVGMVDFRGDEDLVATSKCNGKMIKRNGSEFCQSRAGLLQVIDFDEEVISSSLSPGCSPLEKSFGPFAYEYKISEGFCVYKFMNKSKNKFRLTTFGYTSIKDAL